MHARPIQIAIGLTLLLLTAPAVPVLASEDTSLEELLMKKGVITREEWEKIREQEAPDTDDQPGATDAGGQSATTAQEDAEPRVEIKADYKGIHFERPDGKFKFAFGGRLQIDAGGFIEDVSDMGSGIEMRRARIKSYGTVFYDWDYKLEVNFDPDLNVPLTDAWLRYTHFKPFTITVGHQKVPFSQQSMTSSNWQVFQERALLDAFIDNQENGRRRMGAVLGSYGDQFVHWSLHAGVFGEGLDFTKSGNEDWGTAGRVTIAPIAEKTRVLVFGASAYYRQFRGPTVVRVRSKPEAHLANTSMLDTGLLTNGQSSLTWNVDGSFVLGPFHGQGEFTRGTLDRNQSVVFPGASSNLTFDGWYIQAGWFLTGESRNYDYKSGKYKRIMPRRELLGAWEVAVRYSQLDLDDRDITGGRQSDVTVGLNWWANRNIMFRFNYVYADADPNTSELPATPANPLNPLALREQVHAFMGRAQIVF